MDTVVKPRCGATYGAAGLKQSGHAHLLNQIQTSPQTPAKAGVHGAPIARFRVAGRGRHGYLPLILSLSKDEGIVGKRSVCLEGLKNGGHSTFGNNNQRLRTAVETCLILSLSKEADTCGEAASS
jgi:hypothetical protein